MHSLDAVQCSYQLTPLDGAACLGLTVRNLASAIVGQTWNRPQPGVNIEYQTYLPELSVVTECQAHAFAFFL